MTQPSEVATYLSELPRRIYKARTSWKLTARAAAKEIGISAPTYFRLENTPNYQPEMTTIMKVLHWLDLREEAA